MRKTPFFACLFVSMILVFTNCRKNHDVTPTEPEPPVAVAFTISTDSVKVNPYGYTPLSAMVSFTNSLQGRTFIRVHGRHGSFSDVTHLFADFGSVHTIPVIGMYVDTVNTVDIRIVDNNGDTVATSSVVITTQALPQGMPYSIVASGFDESKVASGMYLVSNLSNISFANSTQPTIPYILDSYGDIRWILDYSSYQPLATMSYDNGIFRLHNGNFFFSDTHTSVIYEVNTLGAIINTWQIPGFIFHHEVYEEKNGNFLLTVSKPGSQLTDGTATTEDYAIEIDRNTKQVITEWDFKESLDEYRRTWGWGTVGDWMHCNGIYEDTTDNTIVVSARNQGVIKFDRSNHVKWILAPHKGWGANRRGEDLNAFLLTPVDASGQPFADTSVAYGSTITDAFEWNCYQHNPIQLPDGDIMMFDNGTNRTLDSLDGNAIYNTMDGKYSRAAEFKIDSAKMTVQQIWQYGKERGVNAYSAIISSVQFLPGNRNVVFAPGFLVRNVNGDGGKIIELNYDTKEVVNEISIASTNVFSAHRVKKMSLYPDNL